MWTDCERLPLTAGCEGPQRPDLPRGAARLRRPQHYLARSARGIRDLDGRPLAFHLTEGQASDSPQFEVLLDLGPDITPRAAVGDKGYDGQSNRTAARERGICPVIPFKSWPETGQLSFRRRFTGRAPASSSWPASSSASSASPSVARKRTRTSALSSLSPSASSSSNPSTGPRIGSSMCTLVDRIDV